MSADALHRVGRALLALVAAEPEVGPGKVVLGPPPMAVARLDGPRLGIFLYRIDISPSLRNHERLIPAATPGELAERRLGLPLELRFLITAFGPEDETGMGAEQLILLGGALRAFARTGVLAVEGLSGQEPRLTIDTLSSEELSRIWNLFPETSFQTSIGVLATPVWIDLGDMRRGAPVTDAHLVYGLGAGPGT
jgi:hypothetical protein